MPRRTGRRLSRPQIGADGVVRKLSQGSSMDSVYEGPIVMPGQTLLSGVETAPDLLQARQRVAFFVGRPALIDEGLTKSLITVAQAVDLRAEAVTGPPRLTYLNDTDLQHNLWRGRSMYVTGARLLDTAKRNGLDTCVADSSTHHVVADVHLSHIRKKKANGSLWTRTIGLQFEAVGKDGQAVLHELNTFGRWRGKDKPRSHFAVPLVQLYGQAGGEGVPGRNDALVNSAQSFVLGKVVELSKVVVDTYNLPDC